ncbi:MAG: lactonase family protein [Lentisphaerae bacterium]|nr:lactonase family protein [Lentisphaerota bacterium]
MKKFCLLLAVAFAVYPALRGESFFVASAKQGILEFDSGKANKPVLDLPYINYLVKDSSRKVYYAALGRVPRKKAKGGAAALLVWDEQKFKIQQILPLQGRNPSHITVSPDGKYLYSANYSDGSIAEIALAENGSMQDVRFIKHTGKSIAKRQKSPHPHQCIFNPAGNELYVCDLGTDEIFIYGYSPESGIKTPVRTKLKLAPGSGPRHLVFSPSGNEIYCANELSGSVTSFVRSNVSWRRVKTLSTLKNPFEKNYPGAIKISACGKFFLVSNRGHNSIALFETAANGDFALLDTISLAGDFPYDILFIDNDRRVVVCNYKSHSVMLFAFDKAQKKLLPEAEYFVEQAKALVE